MSTAWDANADKPTYCPFPKRPDMTVCESDGLLEPSMLPNEIFKCSPPAFVNNSKKLFVATAGEDDDEEELLVELVEAGSVTLFA